MELTSKQQKLITAIESLAKVYSPNATSIPEAVYQHWFNACKGSKLAEALEIIEEWPLVSTKMLLPVDLYKSLQNKRADQREEEAKHWQEAEREPLPKNVGEIAQRMFNVLGQEHSPTDWARRLMVKEAYGFAMSKFQRDAWRSALGRQHDYNFEDFGGAFPIEDMPDQRRDPYHDGQVEFMREYVAAHGLKLEYDKALVHKKYQTQPFRYNGRGVPQPLREGV